MDPKTHTHTSPHTRYEAYDNDDDSPMYFCKDPTSNTLVSGILQQGGKGWREGGGKGWREGGDGGRGGSREGGRGKGEKEKGKERGRGWRERGRGMDGEREG